MSRQHSNKREREEKEVGWILVQASQIVTRFPGCLQISQLSGFHLMYTKLYRMELSLILPEKSQKGNGFFSLGFLFFLILTQSKNLTSIVQVLRDRSSECQQLPSSIKEFAGTPQLSRAPETIRIPPLTPLCLVKHTCMMYKVNWKGTECWWSSWLLFPSV